MNKRTFKVIKIIKNNGCHTKFNKNSEYTKEPMMAAKKALTKHCSVKKIKGSCSFYITIQETTQNSNHKIYTYKCIRKKYKNPVKIKDNNNKLLYKFEYSIHCKRKEVSPKKKKKTKCIQSRGVISKKTKLKRRLKNKNKK